MNPWAGMQPGEPPWWPSNRVGETGNTGDEGESETTPADYWEHRYADAERMWSGTPNRTLVDVLSGIPAGRALDLGCGEGADAIWLAGRGWTVNGVDISPTATARARAAAVDMGVPAEQVSFTAADLTTWSTEETYDLVTASFLHAPVALARTDILRRAAARLAPGGRLLILSHAAFPPWAQTGDGHEHQFLTPAEEITALDLPPSGWATLLAETRPRQATGPDGEPATLDDVVVLLRRN